MSKITAEYYRYQGHKATEIFRKENKHSVYGFCCVLYLVEIRDRGFTCAFELSVSGQFDKRGSLDYCYPDGASAVRACCNALYTYKLPVYLDGQLKSFANEYGRPVPIQTALPF